MKKSENRLKESCQEKRKDKNGKEGPEQTAKQQERDQKKQEKIPEDKRAEWFLGLCFRLCFHLLGPCSVMTTLFDRPTQQRIYFGPQA
ncbi:MAG: hypothetical protein OER59_05280 [Desulfobulbaceae bacterium]|jgi:hypothetical protein|nr:hypothetical protein [Desulfobulbaceae bacterium]MDH3782227.1 hypothetical protein [Desulfobulbaceae bacterium]HKJ15151.1 hypothetical protein [Desulfobulbales bacterium]